jgi:hypothetical protein
MKTREQVIDNFMKDGYLMEFRKKYESGYDPTQLMNEMENVFNIPALNNPSFNENNRDVMSLYQEIANSRKV